MLEALRSWRLYVYKAINIASFRSAQHTMPSITNLYITEARAQCYSFEEKLCCSLISSEYERLVRLLTEGKRKISSDG